MAFALTRSFNMIYITPIADINSGYEDERAHIARATSDCWFMDQYLNYPLKYAWELEDFWIDVLDFGTLTCALKKIK